MTLDKKWTELFSQLKENSTLTDEIYSFLVGEKSLDGEKKGLIDRVLILEGRVLDETELKEYASDLINTLIDDKVKDMLKQIRKSIWKISGAVGGVIGFFYGVLLPILKDML